MLTNVSCVELIHADEGRDGHATEEPGGEWAEDWELALVEVVDKDRVELPCKRMRVRTSHREVEQGEDETRKRMRVRREGGCVCRQRRRLAGDIDKKDKKLSQTSYAPQYDYGSPS